MKNSKDGLTTQQNIIETENWTLKIGEWIANRSQEDSEQIHYPCFLSNSNHLKYMHKLQV